MLKEKGARKGQSELFPSPRTLEGSSACFSFIKRLGEVGYNPDDSDSFSMGEDVHPELTGPMT